MRFFVISWIFGACSSNNTSTPVQNQDATQNQSTQSLSKNTPLTPIKDAEIVEDMVHIPQGLVDLGPRHIEAVEGFSITNNPMGVTPNNGEGADQRAAGGPPLPNMPPSKGGPNGGVLHPNVPNTMGTNGAGQNGAGGSNGPGHPQHKPQFDLNNPSKGVGHMRPGSGVPSAPPNMPGSQAKFTGEEETWTANPSNQMPSKKVTVSDFWMDLTEVTRKDYQKFLQATGYRPPFIAEEWAKDGWNWNGTDYPEGTGDHPVVLVSWYDAQEFCAWRGKRLPTEAEWQLAALGDAALGNIYPWGKTYNHEALNHGKIESPNFDDSDGYLTTSPVGAFPLGNTPYGIQDIFGNAWEFTADARRATWKFYENAEGDILENTFAPGPSLYVAVRGGAYFFDLRPNPGGERNEFLTEVRRKTSGFRCAKSS